MLLLQDSTGKLATGAIATLVDEIGGAVIHEEGLPMNVSVDMSISFLSTADVGVSHSMHLLFFFMCLFNLISSCVVLVILFCQFELGYT